MIGYERTGNSNNITGLRHFGLGFKANDLLLLVGWVVHLISKLIAKWKGETGLTSPNDPRLCVRLGLTRSPTSEETEIIIGYIKSNDSTTNN